jgi:GT2 family glycosyltransferase
MRHIPTITKVQGSTPGAEVLLVVPTLGRRPEFLEQALASIRAQSVPSDIVVVAPCKASEAVAMAAKWGARHIPDPGSLPKAINLGVSEGLAHHSFVAWLNDDDLLEEGSLAATTRVLSEHRDAVVAFGGCRYINERGEVLWVSNAGRWAPRILPWGPDLVPQPGMLIRADAWRRVGGLDTSYRLVFDLDLLLRLRRIGRIVATGTIVSSFRWHADSLTVDSRDVNLQESERAKRQALSPAQRRWAWMWERPVRWATRVAADRLNRRAQRLSA